MRQKFSERELLCISNPNKGWVVKELDRFRDEWSDWFEFSKALGDSPDFHPNTCADAIKDGFSNRRKHDILREKTLVFIGNNFSGYGFLFDNWPSHPHEDVTSRLAKIIPGWLHRLEILGATIEYARVTDGFWKEKAKELASKVVNQTPETAAKIITSYLKNPLDVE